MHEYFMLRMGFNYKYIDGKIDNIGKDKIQIWSKLSNCMHIPLYEFEDLCKCNYDDMTQSGKQGMFR